MKPILPALALSFLASAAYGDLVITEVMASSAHPSNVAPTPDANGDWWELTNTGSEAVNLGGYKWDDIPTPATPTMSTFPAGITIQPGESIIILEEPAANVALWKGVWGLTSATRVIDRTQFASTGGEAFSGLGASGDEINLYNPSGTVVAHVEFGVSTAGVSQAFHRDGSVIHGLNSVIGKQGAYASTYAPSDTGSPGDAKIHFTTAPVVFGKSSYNYAITAVMSGSTAPVISAIGVLPSFLTLTPGSGGTATLASNRPLTLADAGNYSVQLAATSGTSTTIQEFTLSVLNPSPSVILNEYNAVGSTNFLNGGSALADDDGGTASSDAHFGRVLWNGGQWVEFAVLGNGGTGTLDMRGWSVEIGSNEGSGFFASNILKLSNATQWEAVPSRTILTFIDRTTAQGGKDSGFALRDNSATTGEIWSNVWMGDTTLLTYTDVGTNGYTTGGGVVSGIVIDNNNTQFRVKNSSGQVVFGPAGEGVAPRSGISSKEIFELEGHPTTFVSPDVVSTDTTQGYSDGASDSTFGFPNSWISGVSQVTQNFLSVPTPEIAVVSPAGAEMTDNGSQAFSEIAVATNTSLTFTIRNDGTGEVSGLGITIDGANATEFSVTPEAPPALSPTGTTTFTVKFAPTTAGTKNAVLHIASNDSDETSFEINLTGTAFLPAPEIDVLKGSTDLKDGSKVKFSSVKVGKTGKAVTFTIKNTGTAKLTGISMTKDGSHAKDFVVTKLTKTSLNAAGGSTTFKVTFKPAKKGTRTAAIHIKSNDSNESPFDIKLSGTAK